MKIFNKKEEKNKVGRPKLADMDTKKKSIIMCAISLLLVIILLSGGLVSLNILPNFNRLKGNVSLCSEIPARFRPRSESNPEGLHEYGFTDPKFYSAVVSWYNEDASYCSTITEEQLGNIRYISANNSDLTNADGVQYLTSLGTLYLGGNNLSSIDISHNTALKTLRLQNNNLNNIDVSQNTALTYLALSNNNLSSIDVSGNTSLTFLNLYNNNLSSIDVSQNTALTDLALHYNNLSSIDVSQNTALTDLDLQYNNLSSIDVSQNTALTDLALHYNNLSSIDVSQNTALTDLDLQYNNLSSIDVNQNTALTHLSLNGNDISSIDVSQNTALTDLDLSNNNLSSIDLSHNTALTNLYLSSNNLSSIDLSHNTVLETLFLSGNNISSIDLSQNTSLSIFALWGNPYKTYYSTESSITLDSPNIITSYPNDTTYSIDNTSIATYENGVVKRVAPGSTTLNIKYKISESREYTVKHTINFIGITSSLYKIDDEKKTIDLNNEKLENVNKWEFNIEPYGYNLNINGDKLEIKDNNGTVVDTYQMINMKSKVSDAYKKAGFKDKKFYSCVVGKEDEDYLITEEELKRNSWLSCSDKEIEDVTGIEKLTNLQGLYLSNNNLSSIDLSQNTVLETLNLNSNNLSNIDLSHNPALRDLYLNNNNLSSIDLSQNTSLGYLDLYNNNLSSIDLSQNTSLGYLDLSNNNLSSIDLSHNTALYSLYLSNNNLSNIDLSKLENLENVSLDNNKLEEVVLPNSSNLQFVFLHNNNLKSIDLSNYSNLSLSLHNNPLTNTIYIIKDGIVDYNNNVKLNENIKVNYNIDDSGIASYEDGKLKGLKEGTTLFKMSNENIRGYSPGVVDKCFSSTNYENNREYCNSVSEEDAILPYFMSNEIKVYDIKTEAYKIDKDKKIIYAKDQKIDVSKITITIDELKGEVEDNYYVIKKGKKVIDKYKIQNNQEETNTTKKATKSSNTTKKATKSSNTAKNENKDIELSSGIVPNILLQSIKGQDRNIVVKQEGITFIINGKDIESITGNLDLSVEIGNIKESIIKEEVKKELEKAVVLNFRNEGELPGKVLVEVEATDSIKEEVGVKEINVYNYNKEKYNLVAEDLSLKENKISFYIDKLGYYILTNEKVEDKKVEIDDSMMGENTKLNKPVNNKIIIIPIVIITILIIVGIIGFVRYRKNKKR